jgi:RHS repeat-associated protein
MQGQYDDGEIGLYYNTFRYYDYDAGRFATEDPIGLAGGDNLYQYAQNPLRWADPLGLKTFMCKKPLKAFGGEGERSGPDIWGNPLYHQYPKIPKKYIYAGGVMPIAS